MSPRQMREPEVTRVRSNRRAEVPFEDPSEGRDDGGATCLTRLLTADEAAVILNVSLARLYALLREGVVPCCYLGRQVRVSAASLSEFIEQGGQRLPGGWKREA